MIQQSLLNESRYYHSISSGLPRANGVKQPQYYYRQLLLMEIGQGQELVDSLGAGIAPAALGSGTIDRIIIFPEWNFGSFAVDFGSGGNDDFLFILIGHF